MVRVRVLWSQLPPFYSLQSTSTYYYRSFQDTVLDFGQGRWWLWGATRESLRTVVLSQVSAHPTLAVHTSPLACSVQHAHVTPTYNLVPLLVACWPHLPRCWCVGGDDLKPCLAESWPRLWRLGGDSLMHAYVHLVGALASGPASCGFGVSLEMTASCPAWWGADSASRGVDAP